MARDALIGRSAPLRATFRQDLKAAHVFYAGSVWQHAFPNLFVVASYRVAHALHQRGQRVLSHLVALVAQVLTGAEIRPSASIGPGFVVVHPAAVVIGANVVAGSGLTLYGSNTLGWSQQMGSDEQGWPSVGDDVIFFTHASAVGDVRIGNRVRVGAYGLVAHDIPSDSVASGVPAKARPLAPGVDVWYRREWTPEPTA
ncbi:serine O-acetyltransferase [Nocardioides ultimimeridianus]